MTIISNCPIYPRKAFYGDSISKLHFRTTLQLFGYSSSTPFKKLPVFAANDFLDSRFNPQKNHPRKSNLLPRNKKNGWNFSGQAPSRNRKTSKDTDDLGSNSWLDNWNDTHETNRQKKPQLVLNYRNTQDMSSSDTEEGTSTSTSESTMMRIVEKLKKFGYMDDVGGKDDKNGAAIEKGSIEDIFYIEEGILPNRRGGFSKLYPFGDKSVVARDDGEVKFPWEKDVVDEQRHSLDSRKYRSMAELTLPESELRRLKNLTLRIKSKTKIGDAGVTQQVVDIIREKWNTSEVVRLKIEGTPALNMRRMHEILERKTGGLVIWRSGTSVSLYRGAAFEDPTLKLKKKFPGRNETSHKPLSSASRETEHGSLELGPLLHADASQVSVGTKSDNSNSETPSEVKYEDEIDELLDCLGPRYTDWPGDGPLPVDADLLPGVVPGFQTPFRLLPYGVRSTVGMKEATSLRRLARVLPPHFAVGRGRQFQGLATAMVKLWEKSSIAKIALKRGVQLTSSERIAEDLKRLTGGMLLSRNKDFLVYYRGKDFLSPDVAEALLEKEKFAKALQEEEELARFKALSLVSPRVEELNEFGTAGTLKETLDADSRWGKILDDEDRIRVMREAEVLRHSNLVRKLEKKLTFAEKKLMKAERALSKVEESLSPADRSEEQESLSDEERYMFRKLGLRMKAFLLLGRRGVFGGTVENMHLHWKYRELVKIVIKAPNVEEVKSIALALEAESGGVLVSVDKVSKGYAVIVFRGREYKRPSMLRPANLLTKRKALARSIELQRYQDLRKNILTLETRVNQLRSEIEQMGSVLGKGDEELYDKLDSAYSTEDEDSEVEGAYSYLDIYDNDDVDDNHKITSPDQNAFSESNFLYDFQEVSATEFEESNG